MKRYFLTAVMVFLLGPKGAFAAVEYLRFEGSIHSDYNTEFNGYDAALNFQPGEQLRFDFAVDTSADPAPSANAGENSYSDNFAATYRSGTFGDSRETYGSTASFPEGSYSYLFIQNQLRVGNYFSSETQEPFDANTIDNWLVGDRYQLLNNGYYDSNVIGNLTLTYRGEAPPPEPVPLPAPFVLLGSGLVLFWRVLRRIEKK